MDLTASGLWPRLPLGAMSPLLPVPQSSETRPDPASRIQNRPAPHAQTPAPETALPPPLMPSEPPGPDTPAGPPPAFDVSILERERAILSLLLIAAAEATNHNQSKC